MDLHYAALDRELYWRWPRGHCDRRHVLFIDFSGSVFRVQLGIHAFELGELCFRTLGALLSDSQSIAFRLLEHCFQTLRALLSDCRSNALDCKEHASRLYGAMLPMIRSSALMSTKYVPATYAASRRLVPSCITRILPQSGNVVTTIRYCCYHKEVLLLPQRGRVTTIMRCDLYLAQCNGELSVITSAL